jgi:hypothetical protein
MRKHPLLAFATTSLGLIFGALSHGALSAQQHQGQPRPSIATTGANEYNDLATSEGDVQLLSYDAPMARKRVQRPPLTTDRRAQRATLRHQGLHHAERVKQLRLRTAAQKLAQDQTEATGVWASLRSCESGGNYKTDTGNGYYGAYQFSLSSWRVLGYGGLPNEAPPAIQDRAAKALAARQGWHAWPHCSWTAGLA